MDVKSVINVKAIIQQAEESERGWGVRPDGCTIHLDDGARKRFWKNYNNSLPATAPDEYSRPSGSPYVVEIPDDDYDKLVAAVDKNGMWYYNVPVWAKRDKKIDDVSMV